jgi:hypothetical protein
MRSSIQRYLAFVALPFVILMAWKYVFSIFLRPSAQGYVANCERIIGIFVSLNPWIKVHGFCENILIIPSTEKVFLKGHETFYP